MTSWLYIIGIIFLVIIGIIALGILGWIIKAIGSVLGVMFEGIGLGLGCIIKAIFYIVCIGIFICLIL